MLWAELIRVLLMLVLIIALIFGLSVLLRRQQMGRGSAASAIRVLASLSLGAKERLLLVQVGKEQLLVGSSATGLRTLHTLQQAIEVPEPGQLSPAQGFADVLKSMGKGWTP